MARIGEISLPQYRLLLFLRNGPKRAGEVAETSFVTKATISSHITTLKRKGWIATQAGTVDRRVNRLILTHKGKQKMEAFERVLLQRFREMLGDDSDRIFKTLTEMYVLLGKTVEARFEHVEEDFTENKRKKKQIS